jgi:hypothetical protein
MKIAERVRAVAGALASLTVTLAHAHPHPAGTPVVEIAHVHGETVAGVLLITAIGAWGWWRYHAARIDHDRRNAK